MAQQIQYVAQAAYDLYLMDYAQANEFFTLQDFIYHTGLVAADLYQQEFRLVKQEMRAERQEGTVAFSTDWLSAFEFTIEEKNGAFHADIPVKVVSFPYDNQNTGYQSVFINLGNCEVEADRSSLNERWQIKFLPTTDKVFFYPLKGRLEFYNPGGLMLKNRKGKLYYVPGVDDNMELPDGIVNQVINNTVQKFRVLLQQVVVDKSNDGNPNKTIQTEVNPNILKPI